MTIQISPPSDFKAAMRRFASTVSIVTACDHERRHGMTATSVTSLSMEPSSLLVCLNQKTLLHDMVLRTASFCVNVLHQDQLALSAAFSGGLPSERRFELGEWGTAGDGVPYLLDAQVNLFCRKAATIPYGTHMILIGDVESVSMREAAGPLVYHNAAYCFAAPAVPQANPAS